MIKLLRYLRRKETIMAVLCILLVLGQVYFDLLLPDFMSDLTMLINTPGSEMADIWSTGLQMLCCTLAGTFLCILSGYLAARVAAGFSHAVRSKLFGHVLNFGKQEMQQFSVPSLVNRTTNDISQIQMFVSMGLTVLVRAPVMAIWAVCKILGKSWELSVVTAVVAIFLITASIIIVLIALPRFKLVQKLNDQINRVTRENLTGINVVHAFNAEDYQNEKFEGPNHQMMKTQMKNQRLFAILMPMMGLGMNGLSLCIYWLGALLLNNIPLTNFPGRLTMFSDIVVFSTYAGFVILSFMLLIMVFVMFPGAQVSAGRINEVLNTHANIKEGDKTQGSETGTVEFRNVSFSYPGTSEKQLSNISFKVNKGETIAFIGATGSGKTTLVSLIARLYDATAGTVLIDGVNVKKYTFDSLYNRIGFITQKAILFSGSINDNIRFGESTTAFTDDVVDEALDIAQATEFVQKQKLGKDHHIAQGGKNVSGGQKQRLSIARALARHPEILVFDDSFSALDYRTDAALRAALAENLEGTTCVIVAQRISTIRNADKIVVLEGGKAVGIGTHQELMASCDVYREIAMSQLSEDELADKEV